MNDSPVNLLPISYWPDPILGQKASPIDAFDPDLRTLAERMIVTMYESDGVGLAAPQVGKSIRMFVADPQVDPEPNPMVFVNPELHLEGEIVSHEEGCLSIPEVRVQVRRPESARVRAQDLDGEFFEVEASGFAARVWQHEFDHLEGNLIVDRMSPKDRLVNRKILKELKLAAGGA